MESVEKMLQFIDKSDNTIIELETLLTSYPAIAPESGGDGEWLKVAALEKWLKDHGITTIEHFDAPDARVSHGKRPNVVVTIPGKKHNKRLWIMAHTDVVPAGELAQWKQDPFKVLVEGDKIIGRGVEDNQQGLVSSVIAALALREYGITPEHDVKLLFVADEEVGSVYGIDWLLKNTELFKLDDMFIIPDGGKGDSSEIEVAEKNICWIKVTTKGKQCHASKPDDGKNAFLANCEFALLLNAMENTVFTERNPLFDPPRSTLVPTKKDPNVPNINTVPGEDVFYADLRMLPSYSIESTLAAIRDHKEQVEKKYGVTITVEAVMSNESPPTSENAEVVQLLKKSIKKIYNIDARAIGIGGGTVGAYLREKGYQCVVWSTQDETMHAPNEYAKISNIKGDAKVFADLMVTPR
ncbi:MAG TPA: M20 family metallo-hydrolase [Spirochaetales bacterium]|nr:M20 family metallo-hydrolase [Spirochaetales bacterium]HQK33403.1 M20 family metallo-hydrolase [Spirochaetales bacterium]